MAKLSEKDLSRLSRLSSRVDHAQATSCENCDAIYRVGAESSTRLCGDCAQELFQLWVPRLIEAIKDKELVAAQRCINCNAIVDYFHVNCPECDSRDLVGVRVTREERDHE